MGLAPRSQRVFQPLDDEHRRALADYETVALCVKWPRRRFGELVVPRERPRGVEACHRDRADGCLRAAADGNVDDALADEVHAVADGVRAAGAGGDSGKAGSPRAVRNGDIAASHVNQHHGDQEGADAPRPLLTQHLVLLGEGDDAADTAGDKRRNPVPERFPSAATPPDPAPLSLPQGQTARTGRRGGPPCAPCNLWGRSPESPQRSLSQNPQRQMRKCAPRRICRPPTTAMSRPRSVQSG